jgi:hypothetical protein
MDKVQKHNSFNIKQEVESVKCADPLFLMFDSKYKNFKEFLRCY